MCHNSDLLPAVEFLGLSTGAAAPATEGPNAAAAAERPAAAAAATALAAPPVMQAAYLAWAGFEDTINLSARVCGAVLQRSPLIGARLAPKPDQAAQGPSTAVRWLRKGIGMAYGTAGAAVGVSEALFVGKRE